MPIFHKFIFGRGLFRLPCMFRPWDGTLEHAKPPAELMGQWAAEAAQEKGWAAHRIWGWGRAPGGAALHMPCFRFVLSALRGRGLASAPSAVHLPALCWSMARSLLPLRGQVGGARSELQSLRGRGLASAPSADLPALCGPQLKRLRPGQYCSTATGENDRSSSGTVQQSWAGPPNCLRNLATSAPCCPKMWICCHGRDFAPRSAT